MKLHAVDIIIVLGYLLSVSLIGVFLSRRASKNLNSYLLGGKELPWYLLGLSNASGMFDISGTMWLVTIMFVYGLKSVWLPWLWPTFNQIFLMIFLSAWLRRSNVTTGAQWIGTRFGTGAGAQLSTCHRRDLRDHRLPGIHGLRLRRPGQVHGGLHSLGGRLTPTCRSRCPPSTSRISTASCSRWRPIIYTVLGGMTSLVLADILQYAIMTISAVVVAGIAMSNCLEPCPERARWVAQPVLRLETGPGLDRHHRRRSTSKITDDQFSWFSIIMMLMLFKGVMASAAGPAPNYDMQKILATRNPREAALMSGFVSIVLMPVRYLMVTGFAVLGILYYKQLDLTVAGKIDFEQVLPAAMNQFVPVGIMGCLLAGLLAAFLGTFAGTLNAAQAYIMNDFYIKYLRPRAGHRRSEIHELRHGDRHCGRIDPARDVRQGRQDGGQAPAVDRLGSLRRVRGRQHAQVVLVAIQRPRVFLGHGRRHRPRTDLPEGVPADAAAALFPAAVRAVAGRLHHRHVRQRSRRTKRR